MKRHASFPTAHCCLVVLSVSTAREQLIKCIAHYVVTCFRLHGNVKWLQLLYNIADYNKHIIRANKDDKLNYMLSRNVKTDHVNRSATLLNERGLIIMVTPSGILS